MDICVARQPIIDRDAKLYAYELLFRDSNFEFSQNISGDEATSALLTNSYFILGMESLSNEKLVFINFPQNLIENETPLLFPPKNTVIEVLEDVEPTLAVLECCAKLSKQGYRIALDDFVDHDHLSPLVDVADIIKIDFLDTTEAEIRRLVEKYGADKQLLAEKIETQEQRDLAFSLGFDYFQGYFFNRPQLIMGKEIPQIDGSMTELLGILNNVDFSFDELEQAIKKDLSISFKLFKYIAFYLYKPEIDSLRQVLTLLGQEEVRNFVTLMLMANIAPPDSDLVIRLSCVRAKFCEALGALAGRPESAGELFTLGMFSNIHWLLGNSPEQAMAQLPFSNELREALLTQTGWLGGYLKLVLDYERADWAAVSAASKQLGVAEESLSALYNSACEWADRVIR